VLWLDQYQEGRRQQKRKARVLSEDNTQVFSRQYQQECALRFADLLLL